MSAADNPFVTKAMLEAYDCGVADCFTSTEIKSCCKRAGIAAASRAKNAEITDEQIDNAVEDLMPTCNGAWRAGRRSALRELFLGVEVSE